MALLFKNLEVVFALVTTLIGLLFIVLDIFRALPNLFTLEEDDPPPASILIGMLVFTATAAFLGAFLSGGTERDIVAPIMRSLAFATIPQLPGIMIRSQDTFLYKFFFICVLPLIAIITEVTLLDMVVRSCRSQCASWIVNNPLLEQILIFSALDYL